MRREGSASVLTSLSWSTKAGLVSVSLLFAIAAVTLVEWDTDKFSELEQTRSVGFTVLEAAGMGGVDRARAIVKERQQADDNAVLRVRQAQAEVNMADQKKDRVSDELDSLDEKMDKESGEISKDQANAETLGDSSAEVILKARERAHQAKTDRRHSDMGLRREKREEDALTVIRSETAEMSKKAAKELTDAMKRKDDADKLRAIAQKHLDKVAALKDLIHQTLKSKIAKLQQQIESKEHDALRQTENAKADDAKHSKLEAKLAKEDAAEKAAQRRADNAALSAESADERAEREAKKISGDLASAEKKRRELAARLRDAENPSSASFKPRGSVDSDPEDVAPTVPKMQSHHKDKLQREMDEAAEKIKELTAAKAAADKRARAERKAAEKLKKLLEESRDSAKKKVKIVSQPALATKVENESPEAPRGIDDNFSASMNYLNNRHLDAATGADDKGRDAVGRESEGRRAYVGVYGRSPQLDSIATANLRQYEQDESELAHANYERDDSPLDHNIF